MLRKLYYSIVFVIVSTSISLAQTGALKGTIKDKASGETIPFVNVILQQAGGTQIGAATTDFDGNFTIKPIPPGKYTLRAVLMGYQEKEIAGVIISADKTTYVTEADLGMSQTSVALKTVEVITYSEPLIDPDMKTGGTVTREEYQAMATKNVYSAASLTAGVYQKDEGGSLNVRGGRSEQKDGFGRETGESSTDTYVDGVRVRGKVNISQGAVEQVTIITGGVPASYGDNTGGVINITTRGPASQFSGGVEAISSQFLDAFGYNSFVFNASGPILVKKDTVAKTSVTKLGFFVSGQASTEKDPDPSAIGAWKVKDEVLADLEKNPLSQNPNGGTIRNAEKIRKSDLEHIDAKQNVRANGYQLSGKLVYQATPNLTLTLGGAGDYNKSHGYVYEYALFNPVNNPELITTNWNLYGKITQKFGSDEANKDEKSSSNIKNAYYTLQAEYTSLTAVTQDDNHKKNYFDYGYIGKFKTYKKKNFEEAEVRNELGELLYTYEKQIQDEDTLITFEANEELNPLGAAYTKQFYEIYKDEPDGHFRSIAQIRSGGGFLNGERPSNVYSLFYNTGRQYGGYSISDQTQFRVFTNFSADIKNHAIQVGFEYEQRVDRAFSLTSIDEQGGLWGLAYRKTNTHIDIDPSKASYSYNSGGVIDTIFYETSADLSIQSTFDRNFRKSVGAAENEWIDIHSYTPDKFSLDMFSADELLNTGNPFYVSYYGYDYTGEKQKKKVNFEDFFTKKNDQGDNTRDIAAFQPLYMAGYIQDKFEFKDIRFNIGVRVDRFDANQKVLKDKYSLFETMKVRDINLEDRPANIGDDYVVYVSDLVNPSDDEATGNVIGFRNGNTWYNKDGSILNDPSILAQASPTGIAPWLVNKEDRKTSIRIQDSTYVPGGAFTDYNPQINVMPRIAFAFPISDVASFTAHYDVLTERPNRNLRLDPLDYYYLTNTNIGVINNPDLKPQRTTDYELGFSQVLNERGNSAINISAFYRELRNQLQIRQVIGAFPVTYSTYDNIDFGTVKGFTFSYDLRRTGNVRMNASYTLQFAEGTGSSATSQANLVATGVPNLRTLVPLDYDQRHTLTTNLDFRYYAGAEYNGPTINGKKILQNSGANFTFRAGSGVPYSRQLNVTQEAAVGVQQTSSLKGDVNGSRLPWNFRTDLRVDKSLEIKYGKAAEESERKSTSITVYVQVLNLFNSENVQGVYKYTGNPNDDGYLTSPAAQSSINAQIDPVSFRDLYSIKVNDPDNYSIPRRIRLGVTLDF